MDRIDELERTMRRHMLAALPPDASCELLRMDLRSLIGVYGTWRERVPGAWPRRVHLSPELLANPARAAYSNGLTAAVRAIAIGASLRPRMSTNVRFAFNAAPPPFSLDRPLHGHLDRLLATWGLHHLHLGTAPHKRLPDFLEGTRHVVFAAFVGADAYLIDIGEHEKHGDNWSKLALLETVVRNWPDEGILYASNFAIGLEGGNSTDEERQGLRRASINDAVEIDGRVWSARNSQTLAGGSATADRHGMRLVWELDCWRKDLDALDADLSAAAARHSLPTDSWSGTVYEERFGFQNGPVFVPCGSLVHL